ncbi:MAG: ATP-grasp domain-containing protein [Clostridia bacterium]
MEDLDSSPMSIKKIGIVYNLKQKNVAQKTADAQAEYDSIDTVYAIRNALSKANYQVELVEMDANFVENIKKANVDFVFNIAEGIGQRGRESQVPAILTMLNIPFTGSDETTLAIALDKALTKRVLSTFKINTPKSKLIQKTDKLSKLNGIKFPVIVKPNAEGSSKGISNNSVVKNKQELVALLKENFDNYNSAMLVEEFIVGREFTVALLGNGENVKAFFPMEIVYTKKVTEDYNLYSYSVKQDFLNYVRLECPPKMDKDVMQKMMDIAKKIFISLDCKDFARIDFMMSKTNDIYFIEINPLPGLAPNYSDFPMITGFCSVDYDTTVQTIMKNAIARLQNNY